MRFGPVPRGVLATKNRRENQIANTYNNVKPSAYLGVAEQPHGLKEESHLAAQPVHGGVREFFVHGIQVEADRRAVFDHLGYQKLEFAPGGVSEIGTYLVFGIMTLYNFRNL
jgi:hypothetical protein